MLSRLKGIETIFQYVLNSYHGTLDMLSRLKGIETVDGRGSCFALPATFGYAFPFEGN